MGAHPPMISLSHGAWMCLIVSVVWYGASSSPQWFICAFTRAQWHFHPAGGGGGVGAARCQAGLRGETVMHLSPFVLKEGFRVEAIKGRAVWVGWTNRARNFRPGFGCCLRKFGIWGVSPSLFLSLTLSLALLHRLSLCVSAFDSLEESDPTGAQLYPSKVEEKKSAISTVKKGADLISSPVNDQSDHLWANTLLLWRMNRSSLYCDGVKYPPENPSVFTASVPDPVWCTQVCVCGGVMCVGLLLWITNKMLKPLNMAASSSCSRCVYWSCCLCPINGALGVCFSQQQHLLPRLRFNNRVRDSPLPPELPGRFGLNLLLVSRRF